MNMSQLVGIVALLSCLHTSGDAGFGHENHPERMPDPHDPISFRFYVMENIGANAKALKAKVDAGQLDEVKLNAAAIAIHATRIETLFPAGSASDSSRAKDEIWQKWDVFLASTNRLMTQADALAVAAGHGDVQAVASHMRNMFATCKSCHDEFRKPNRR